MKALDAEGVAHIVALAKLKPDEDELIEMVKHLNRMVGFCEQIDEVDTTDINPMISVSDCVNILREDVEVASSISSSDALAGAPDRKDRYFRVPQLVHRDE